ncbi:PCRF domain-containing protein, partial [Candidatus Omnitrophota bacterium]
MKRIYDRYDDLCNRLSSEEVLTNPQLLSQVAKERSDLEAKVTLFRRYEDIAKQLDEVKQLVSEETDFEMLELAREENETLENELNELEENIKLMLLPADPLDGKDIIMEIRAGTGGEEAALFASNLYRMY